MKETSGLVIVEQKKPILNLSQVVGFNGSRVTNQEIYAFILRYGTQFLESRRGALQISSVEYIPKRSSDYRMHQAGLEMVEGRWRVRHYQKTVEDRETIKANVGHELGHIFWIDHLDEGLRRLWEADLEASMIPEDYKWTKELFKRTGDGLDYVEETFCEGVADYMVDNPADDWRMITIKRLLDSTRKE